MATMEVETPIKQCITVLDKKVRNLEKKKVKLDAYRDKAKDGSMLDKDQQEAVTKYDIVMNNLDFSRELQKQFQQISNETDKSVKKQAKRDKLERQQHDCIRLQEVLKLNQVNSLIRSAKNNKDYELVISQEEAKQLADFGDSIFPPLDLQSSVTENSVASEHLYQLLEKSDKEFQTGLTYKHLATLLHSLDASKLFKKIISSAEEIEENNKVTDADKSEEKIKAMDLMTNKKDEITLQTKSIIEENFVEYRDLNEENVVRPCNNTLYEQGDIGRIESCHLNKALKTGQENNDHIQSIHLNSQLDNDSPTLDSEDRQQSENWLSTSQSSSYISKYDNRVLLSSLNSEKLSLSSINNKHFETALPESRVQYDKFLINHGCSNEITNILNHRGKNENKMADVNISLLSNNNNIQTYSFNPSVESTYLEHQRSIPIPNGEEEQIQIEKIGIMQASSTKPLADLNLFERADIQNNIQQQYSHQQDRNWANQSVYMNMSQSMYSSELGQQQQQLIYDHEHQHVMGMIANPEDRNKPKPLQEIVSAIQGNYNFLQESQIDIENNNINILSTSGVNSMSSHSQNQTSDHAIPTSSLHLQSEDCTKPRNINMYANPLVPSHDLNDKSVINQSTCESRLADAINHTNNQYNSGSKKSQIGQLSAISQNQLPLSQHHINRLNLHHQQQEVNQMTGQQQQVHFDRGHHHHQSLIHNSSTQSPNVLYNNQLIQQSAADLYQQQLSNMSRVPLEQMHHAVPVPAYAPLSNNFKESNGNQHVLSNKQLTGEEGMTSTYQFTLGRHPQALVLGPQPIPLPNQISEKNGASLDQSESPSYLVMNHHLQKEEPDKVGKFDNNNENKTFNNKNHYPLERSNNSNEQHYLTLDQEQLRNRNNNYKMNPNANIFRSVYLATDAEIAADAGEKDEPYSDQNSRTNFKTNDDNNKKVYSKFDNSEIISLSDSSNPSNSTLTTTMHGVSKSLEHRNKPSDDVNVSNEKEIKNVDGTSSNQSDVVSIIDVSGSTPATRTFAQTAGAAFIGNHGVQQHHQQQQGGRSQHVNNQNQPGFGNNSSRTGSLGQGSYANNNNTNIASAGGNCGQTNIGSHHQSAPVNPSNNSFNRQSGFYPARQSHSRNHLNQQQQQAALNHQNQEFVTYTASGYRGIQEDHSAQKQDFNVAVGKINMDDHRHNFGVGNKNNMNAGDNSQQHISVVRNVNNKDTNLGGQQNSAILLNDSGPSAVAMMNNMSNNNNNNRSISGSKKYGIGLQQQHHGMVGGRSGGGHQTTNQFYGGKGSNSANNNNNRGFGSGSASGPGHFRAQQQNHYNQQREQTSA